MGIKQFFRGREIFVMNPNDDCFTDGRTGAAGSRKFLDTKTYAVFNQLAAILEERNGLSPLYTDNTKWPIFENGKK
jgi:hypothetical protein